MDGLVLGERISRNRVIALNKSYVLSQSKQTFIHTLQQTGDGDILLLWCCIIISYSYYGGKKIVYQRRSLIFIIFVKTACSKTECLVHE